MMNGPLCERLESFFAALERTESGRVLLEEGKGSFHLAVEQREGMSIRVREGRIRVTPAPPEIAPDEHVTRLSVPQKSTLEQLIDGSSSFWATVIPLSGEHGTLLFVDNWMAKKAAINWLGRVIRTAQEYRGLGADSEP